MGTSSRLKTQAPGVMVGVTMLEDVDGAMPMHTSDIDNGRR